MSGQWLACCGRSHREATCRAVEGLGASNGTEFLANPDDMRRMGEQEPGRYGAVVGEGVPGVSEVNLAAVLAASGDFTQVVLAVRGVSGSLRSRAARAGIDAVIDVAGLEGAGVPGRGRSPAGDVAPVAPVAAGPAPAPAGPAAVPTGPAAADDIRAQVPPAPLVREVDRRHVVPTPPAVKGRGPVVAFCSGRGGVGKTALVAVCAAVAAGWGLRVAVLDLDLSCGNLYTCFGLPEGFDILRGGAEGGPRASASPRGVAACEGVRLFGPCPRPELAEEAMPLVEGLICDASEGFDLVLVDTSTTFTDGVAQAIQLADRVLIVSDGAGGSAAASARVAGLAVRLGVARTRIARLENKAPARGRPEPVFPSAAVGLEGARTFSVLDGGEEARELICAGGAAELAELGGPLSDSASTLLAQVLAELGQLPESEAASRALAAATPRKRSFFGRKREARSA